MLLLNRACVHAKTASQQTPLHLGAFQGHTLCISELLLGDADKDVVDRHGRTPLFKAAENNHLEAVEKLLAFGANCGMFSSNPRTCPVRVAANRGHAD
ncbi:unnamed protein product, partial [Ectocarpus sp. 12 AP-2014]